MADTNSKFRIFIVCVVWLCLLGGGVAVYRWWWKPTAEAKVEAKKEKEKQAIFDYTISKKRYQYEPRFAFDSFSGYGPWRSQTFSEEANSYDIGVNFRDDRADYAARFESLASGDCDIAVFTIDALIKASHDHGSLPITIVDILDETRGADAMWGSSDMFPNIDALNDNRLRIVCMKDTPSETLGRVVMAYFNLTNLSPANFEYKDSPTEIYEDFKNSKPTDMKVWISWEPFVSKSLDDKHRVIVDSSKFRGYIVDVLVVNRAFLVKNEPLVENIIKSYRTTLFKLRNNMEDVVLDDSRVIGDPIDESQAKKLVEGIWWKNTQESFGHFGLTKGHGLQHMSEMIGNITDVLLKTGAIQSDPTNNRPEVLYFDGIVRKLHEASWHPGFGHEQIRREKALLALSDGEWGSLKPVGTLQIQQLVFARGTSKLSTRSYATLDDLAEKLTTWPQYYLVVMGNASNQGDLTANKALAEARSRAAAEYLIGKGIDKNRINSQSVEPHRGSGETTVTFVLGELPY